MRRLLLLSALLLAGCQDARSASTGWETRADTLPSGVVALTHTPPADERPTWVLREELRIGSVEGGGPASFGEVRGIAVDASGRIAVLDGQAQEIRVFGPDGRHLHTHGRKGGGPGEFENASGLMTSSDGLLYVPDQQNVRMSVVDVEKGFLRSHPLRLLRFGYLWDGAMLEDDRIVVHSIVLETRRDLLRIYSPQLEQVDSILLPERPAVDREDPPGAYAWQTPDGRTRGFTSVPFYASAVTLLSRSGDVWSSQGGDAGYQIARWRPPADTLVTIRTRRPPVPVTAAERDSAFQGVAGQLSERGVSGLDPGKIPGSKPAVVSLFEADDGDLWVETSSPDTLRRFDVYARDGSIRGSVATGLPISGPVRPLVRGESVYAVVTDEMDVQHVVRARLARAEPDR